MKAMVLKETCEIKIRKDQEPALGLPLKEKLLELVELPNPVPGLRQILVKISGCGVCHTEIDEIEGRRQPKLPIILGHEVVGRVEDLGSGASKFEIGDRVGIAWIYSSCGRCNLCQEGKENLCDQFQGTGCDANGGYAQYIVISEGFAYKIPERFGDLEAAPLLCAGAIGYRALNLTGIQDGQTLGLFGFGASAHIVIQISKYKYPNSQIFVFTRGEKHQKLAKRLGADWTGLPGDLSPKKINCAIDFTPVGETIPKALEVLERGGRLVINAIRKRDPVELDYTKHFWYEKEVKSVANITRRDAQEFLPLAAEIPITPKIQEFKLEDANEALNLLKHGKIQGAGVLKIARP
jgi:propanol-preferring alcohol dehydrogenase